MDIGFFIFCVTGFAFNLFLLIAVILFVKYEPLAAGVATYIGGICVASCIMSGYEIIEFITECLE